MSDECLARLDDFEGVPFLYQRDVITVRIVSQAEYKDGTAASNAADEKQDVVQCYTYLSKHFDQALLSKETFRLYDSAGSHGLPYGRK